LVEKLDLKPAQSATFVFEGVEVYLLLGDLIDIGKEILRLEKEIAEAEKHLEKIKIKLANANFLAKAAPEVVTKEKAEAELLAAKLTVLKENLASLR